MSYTREQEMAVTAPKGNLLVTAAAGAGKTHVLTGRIIGRLTDAEGGTDVDRLLVVTFTIAAAAEMRERIEAAIAAEMEKNPGSQRLSRQMALLPNASINTIDAFCQRMVREYFYRLDISPSFGIIDPQDDEVLRAEALEEAIESLHREGHKDFLAFAETYSDARSDDAVGKMIDDLYRQSESLPFPEDFYQKILSVYEGENQEWCEQLAADAYALFDDAISEATDSRERMSEEKYIKYFSDVVEMLRLGKECGPSYTALHEFMNTHTLYGSKPRLSGESEESKEFFKFHQERIKSTINDIKKRVEFSIEEANERMRELAPMVRGLVAGAQRLSEELRKEKARRNLWSFSDVARMCLSLFADRDAEGNIIPSEVAQEVRERYDEIYIDEYQDSNDIQEWIFRLISGEWIGTPNMFMVGDLKQSIYRFRHCNPELFRQKKELFSSDSEAPNRKIELTKNFRSRREVIDGVNVLFRSLMSATAGEVVYDQKEELSFGATTYDFSPPEGNGCELLLVNHSDVSSTDEEQEELSKVEKEAVLICRRIQELMESGFTVFDKKKGAERPLAYGDVAVLMRDTKKESDLVSYVFEAMGIPLSVAKKGGFYDSLEVRTVLALLELLDNARQDIPLAAVLRSAMVGMWDSDLAAIHMEKKKAPLYDALLQMARKEEGVLPWKCRTFLENLKRWREMARCFSMEELLSILLEETGWYSYVGALPGGEYRQANLRMLRRLAMHYDQGGGSGLFSFIRSIQRKREQKKDLDEATPKDASMNVVSLLTIHKSKGLEFPVVFVASLGKEINKKDATGNLLIHPKMGVGMNCIRENIRFSNPYRDAVAEAIRRENISEELRILYVAVTRAREKLVLTAGVKDAAAAKELWKEKELTPNSVRKAKSFLDWVGPVVMQDKNNTFSFKVYPADSLSVSPVEEPEKEENDFNVTKSAEVEEALSYRYPFEPLAEIPPLFTVTELKGMAKKEEEDHSYHLHKKPSQQAFTLMREEKELSPMEKGSVNHFVMQHLDVKTAFSEEDVKKVVAQMVEKDLITSRQSEAVDTLAITKFLETPLCARMRKADKIHRESPFMMSIPCSEIPGLERGGEEKVVVQGIVDCYFEDEQGLVVLDYKTDRTGDAEEIKKRYRVQMDLYEKALLLKNLKKSSEKFIYLFYNGSIIEM